MDYIQQLAARYPALADIEDTIRQACQLLTDTFSTKGKLLVAGNGGSAADAEHIAGELMKGFVKKRPLPDDFVAELRRINPEAAEYIGSVLQQGLPCMALSSHTALTTACINDMDGNSIYAQQVYGYGRAGDLFLGISTSGNARNVLYAMITASAKKMKTIALTGGSGGEIARYADVSVIVPESETWKIQELHLPVYHAWCLAVEDHFFK